MAVMTRWDDLQILRLLDELEGSEPGVLRDGRMLMERARPGGQLDYQRDPAPFARELLLARKAGYVTFDDQTWHRPLADPVHDAFQWLQQISDIALTISGRDRARGREIITPLPDPDQDDGRMISGLVLEEIARSIADAFTDTQLAQFLVESGVPEELVPAAVAGAKWEYVRDVLVTLHDGGSAARRVLRTFIAAWLSDRLHESPAERARRQIVDRLGRQGWHIVGETLVVGERTTVDPGALAPLDKDARIASLHPDVRQVAGRYLDSGHPEVAIFEAFKAVNNRVKDMSGSDRDGQSLMGAVMGDDNPVIRFGDLTTETGKNLQTGFRLMFMGAVSGIRNPDAHEQFRALSDAEAFEILSFASLLMRRLDVAVIAAGGSKADRGVS